MMRAKTLLVLGILWAVARGADAPPVIDMHVHCYGPKAPYGIEDHYGNKGPATMEQHQAETFAWFQRHNIVKAMVCGSVENVDRWKASDAENRVIRGLYLQHPGDGGMTPDRLEALIKDGKVQVFGEIAPYYAGLTLADPGWEPYLSLCEKYDIPVGVHTGGGDPGGTHSWAPKARLALGDPYLVEDVLVRHPRLRVYLMHAGEDWHEHALRLMAYYPNLYADVAVLLWVEPLDQRYAVEFLRQAKAAGYLDRVMFGSDQMFWPDAIDRSLKFFHSLDFLSEAEKRGVLHDNAARFLRLQAKCTRPKPRNPEGVSVCGLWLAG